MKRVEPIVIDAEGKALGRIATAAATVLIGKHRPTYIPNVDAADTVSVVNAGKIRWTGRKLEQKVYHSTSMYPGGLKTKLARDVFAADPAETVRRAVWRMLPKNTLRAKRIKRLHVTS